ncbi:uncharacterized protein METZ01_LOCUS355884 [marine metagenome]|uniref:Uncharacterized protein n=1 Tax=marine metagenome TaxID=408172 RepID=A0A382RZU1_9ZZZZ
MEFSQYKANAMKKLDYAKSEGLVDEGVIEVLNAFNSHTCRPSGWRIHLR